MHRIQVADGRAVLIRRALHGDEPSIQGFVQGLSAQSRYERFLHPLREVTQSMLQDMVQPDEVHGTTLLALAGVADLEVVGLAQFDVVEPGHAEVAVIVDEGWRRVGLATRLLRALETASVAVGIAEAHADILRENPAALMLARQMGCVVEATSGDLYTLHVTKRMTLPSTNLQRSLEERGLLNPG